MAASPRPPSAPDRAGITPAPDGSFYTSRVSNAFPPPSPHRLIALVPSILIAIALRGFTNQFAQPSRNVRFTIGGGALVLTLVSYLSSIVIYAVSTVASAHVLAHDAAAVSQGSAARVSRPQGLRFGVSRVLPMIG